MMNNNAFTDFLRQHNDADWAAIVKDLVPAIHPVDAVATQIWFKFWPYDLLAALESTDDQAKLEKRLLLQGKFYLKNQIDTSHTFLYGHSYWPQVKQAVAEYARTQTSGNPAEIIRSAAAAVAAQVKDETAVLLGITAVGFMTLQHIGLEALQAAPGFVQKQHFSVNSPAKILNQRNREESQGLFGFLRTVDKKWTVTFDENDSSSNFITMDAEELASGAARDQTKNWREKDPRCGEGPIPVECRSAACGTCWVGVLGGTENLSEVSVLEGKRIKLFGYIDTDEPKPFVRLACMARAGGAVSVVIPPWNGVFGKYLKKQEDAEEVSVAESVA